MRRITKQGEPPLLAAAREDGRGYKSLDPATKQAMQQKLCAEQGHLCAFCESAIEPTGADMRIAHFVPRDSAPQRQLDWSNLLGVCHGNAPPGENKARSLLPSPPPAVPAARDKALAQLHCDAKQGNQPLDPRLDPCRITAGTVTYQPDGTIDASEAKLARELNQVLGLNHRRLVENRLAALDQLITIEAASGVSLAVLLQRTPDASGRLTAYLSFLEAMVALRASAGP